MTIDESLAELGGLPVREYVPGAGLADPAEVAWRLRIPPDGSPFLDGCLRPFLDEPGVGTVTALVIGMWSADPMDDSCALVVELARHADRLPAVRALFLGDITQDECALTSIRHGEVAGLVGAFPSLEESRVRAAGSR